MIQINIAADIAEILSPFVYIQSLSIALRGLTWGEPPLINNNHRWLNSYLFIQKKEQYTVDTHLFVKTFSQTIVDHEIYSFLLWN